ncbi:1, 4-beta cellobiohydrolase [Mycena epipterygia]|nr:1, 4-beta cellobiohydrolase [Mycena epipterygia]
MFHSLVFLASLSLLALAAPVAEERAADAGTDVIVKTTTGSTTTASAPVGSQTPTAGNPYTDYQIYLTPFYTAEATAAANITDASTLGTYLADASAQGKAAGAKMLVQIIVNDVPDAASNGEFSIANKRSQENYFNYIDQLMAQIQKFPDVRVVAIIEPDSLANLVTNLRVRECANAQTNACVTYAIQQLNTLGNFIHSYTYLDAGYAGWLGWPANLSPAAQLFTLLYKNAGSPSFVCGLSTDVANYNAVSLAATPTRSRQGNPNYDEIHYINALAPVLASSGFPAHFIVDQGRSGPGGECDGTSDSSSPRFDFHCGLSDADQPVPEAGSWF